MDVLNLIVLLALFTLLSVTVFALVGKKKVEQRMDDPAAPKSALAKDSPGDGAVERLDRVD